MYHRGLYNRVSKIPFPRTLQIVQGVEPTHHVRTPSEGFSELPNDLLHSLPFTIPGQSHIDERLSWKAHPALSGRVVLETRAVRGCEGEEGL